MQLDISSIEISKSDAKREIKFPKELSKELAELIGIIIGDGHVRSKREKNSDGSKSLRSDIIISGNKKESEYLKYVQELFYSLFNLRLSYREDNPSNAVMLRAHSKGIVHFLNSVCGIPLNKKGSIVCIPDIIKEGRKEVMCSFLTGLADTDFSLTFQKKTREKHHYPVIKGSFKSRVLVIDLRKALEELGFSCSCYLNEVRHDKRFGPVVMHNLFLYGRENLSRWVTLIGFKNEKFRRKLRKWDQEGFCPPGY